MGEHSPLPWKIGAKAPTLILTTYDEGVAVATPHGRKTPLRMEITLANAAYIVQACNAFPDLEKYAREVTAALTDLAGGGSEFFAGKIGEIYKADILFCVNRIEERSTKQHAQILRESKARQELKAVNDDLVKALEELVLSLSMLPNTREKHFADTFEFARTAIAKAKAGA